MLAHCVASLQRALDAAAQRGGPLRQHGIDFDPFGARRQRMLAQRVGLRLETDDDLARHRWQPASGAGGDC